MFTLPVIPAEQVLGMGDAANPLGTHAIAAAVRERVRAGFAGRPGALLYDAEERVRTIGLRTAQDRRLGARAGLPYSVAMMEAAGARLARVIGLMIRPARKAVVVDADNILWGGAVGEVGVDGLNFGPDDSVAYREFQAFPLELRRAGVLLALCSKNTEADVRAAFERREMRLHREDLSAWRIGWDATSVALGEIAAELGVGTDSLIFVDDSPVEIAAANSELPEVATVLMPTDPTSWYEAMSGATVLDRLPRRPRTGSGSSGFPRPATTAA